MREITKIVRARVFEYSELDEEDQSLVATAVRVRHNAQAPYSKFHVGAAARFAGGQVYVGVNHEAASWTQTTHAEQTAIVSAVAAGCRSPLIAMAIAGGPAGMKITLPPVVGPNPVASFSDLSPSCGHCLQIMWEQCDGNPDVRLLQLHHSGDIAITTMGDAFPMAFGPKHLGIDVFAR
jgi:cytidine deaminase